MQKFNQSGIGQTLYVNFDQDISTATAINIKLLPQSGEELTETGTLGTSDVWVEDQKLLANQYATYTVEEDEFADWTGLWKYQGIATLPSSTVATEYTLFRVTK